MGQFLCHRRLGSGRVDRITVRRDDVDRQPSAAPRAAGAAFATPTIVHFSVVLFLAALLRAPWDAIAPTAVICGATGLGGAIYALVTAWRMRAQSTYKPDFEDWLFHAVLPLAAYAGVAAGGFSALAHTHEAMFAVAGATLLLLFTGIHNAWDAVAYHVLVNLQKRDGN
jgi:hypothetical protein